MASTTRVDVKMMTKTHPVIVRRLMDRNLQSAFDKSFFQSFHSFCPPFRRDVLIKSLTSDTESL